jgi:hypothetical protein
MSRRALLLVVGVVALAGCELNPYRFGDQGRWAFPDGTVPDGGQQRDAYVVPDGCVPSPEVCDEQDNDCDGLFDEDEDGLPLTLADPSNCGTCGYVCQFANAIPSCEGGECVLSACNPGYHDINDDPDDGCEYPCLVTNGGVEICDGRDNDCDGLVDETFDLDSDPNNCGECANTCVFLNGIGDCQGGECVIGYCDPPFADADGNPANGCECLLDLEEGTTVCTEGAPGTCGAGEVCGDLDGDGTAHCAVIPAEVCDGRDNDCNGLTDADDDLSADPRAGIQCYGDPDGLCSDPAHAGATTCVNGEITCGGAALLRQNQLAETCNGIDDDCDGVVYDNSTGELRPERQLPLPDGDRPLRGREPRVRGRHPAGHRDVQRDRRRLRRRDRPDRRAAAERLGGHLQRAHPAAAGRHEPVSGGKPRLRGRRRGLPGLRGTDLGGGRLRRRLQLRRRADQPAEPADEREPLRDLRQRLLRGAPGVPRHLGLRERDLSVPGVPVRLARPQRRPDLRVRLPAQRLRDLQRAG